MKKFFLATAFILATATLASAADGTSPIAHMGRKASGKHTWLKAGERYLNVWGGKPVNVWFISSNDEVVAISDGNSQSVRFEPIEIVAARIWVGYCGHCHGPGVHPAADNYPAVIR